jgi:hypothetical protein
LLAPARGWIYGLTEYRNHLASYLSNYHTCQKYGAKFLLLPHDVWGTDHANSSTVWLGDNEDWTDYDLHIRTHRLLRSVYLFFLNSPASSSFLLTRCESQKRVVHGWSRHLRSLCGLPHATKISICELHDNAVKALGI